MRARCRQPLGIGRHAFQADQIVQLADNGGFMGGAIIVDLLAQIRRDGRARDQKGERGRREALHFLAAMTLISTLAPRSSLATWTKARAG